MHGVEHTTFMGFCILILTEESLALWCGESEMSLIVLHNHHEMKRVLNLADTVQSSQMNKELEIGTASRDYLPSLARVCGIAQTG